MTEIEEGVANSMRKFEFATENGLIEEMIAELQCTTRFGWRVGLESDANSSGLLPLQRTASRLVLPILVGCISYTCDRVHSLPRTTGPPSCPISEETWNIRWCSGVSVVHWLTVLC